MQSGHGRNGIYTRLKNNYAPMNLTLIPMFLGNLRGSEIIIIALVILLLFGGRKIPELMRGIGKGINSFRQGMKEVNDEITSSGSSEPKDNTEK